MELWTRQNPAKLFASQVLFRKLPGSESAKLHFQLWNCGNNVPQVVGASQVVVGAQFDLRANSTTGLISGWVYGNNQISCGNVQSSQWLVTEYKNSAQARKAGGG
jgi:hypothetical protein